MAAITLAFAAPAAALGPPSVYARPIGSLSEPLGPWQQLPAELSSMGPYEIGVGIQPTSDPDNGQAVEVDLVSMPGGPAPRSWQDFDPYTPYCEGVTSGWGSIAETGASLFFHGNGVYTLNVSVYTNAQRRSMPGNTCSGGPTSAVTLTVDARGAITVVGTPIVPRTTLPEPRFVGIQLNAPLGAIQDRWRCARDPVRSADGPVTGSAITSSSPERDDPLTLREDETVAFTRPGRWACSVQMLGGDSRFQGDLFATPWTTTPTFVVQGQYERDQTRTSVSRLPHGQVRMTVHAMPQIATAAAGGRLTLKIYRAACRRKVVLQRALQRTARVDRHGVARFSFHTPGTAGFYLGRLRFGGNSLILAGRDPSDMTLVAQGDPAHRAFGFVDPGAWAPC